MKKAVGFVMMLLVGAILGYLLTHFLSGGAEAAARPSIPKTYKLSLLLCLPLVFLLVVGVHELGHVAVGLTQKFNFFGLTVGPFSWKPDDVGRIRFKWNTNLNVAGGVAIMLPDGAEDLRRRFMWFAAGGPLASLLLAGVFFLPVLVGWLDGLLFLWLLCFAVAGMSSLIFIATMLPFRAGGFASDGLRILTFAMNGPTAGADLAGLQALAHLRAGKPHADLSVEEMAAVSANPDVPAQQRVTMDYYRYLHALATDNITAAAALYDSVLDRLDVYPSGATGSFYLEKALFEARYRNNLAAAEQALALTTDSPFTEALSIHLAKAAIADLRGDDAALASELPGIEQGLAKSMDQSRVPVIRNWLLEWKSKTTAIK